MTFLLFNLDNDIHVSVSAVGSYVFLLVLWYEMFLWKMRDLFHGSSIVV